MNIKQMKSMVSRFRHADFSGVQDPAMRAKAQKLQAKQKGFTLLELLVVITLLAILATGALVAYDGAGDKAQSSKAANTIAVLDQGVRAYRAVSQAYPNQWDNLADPVADDTPAGGSDYIPEGLQDILGSVNLYDVFEDGFNITTGVSDVKDAIEDYFEDNFGMDEIQHVFGGSNGVPAGVEPNRAHNEGTNPPDTSGNGAIETEYSDFAASGALVSGTPAFISILASDAFDNEAATPTLIGCNVAGVDLTATFTSGTGVAGADPLVINSINDALSTERCNLVLALGFGGDAAQSTVDSAAGVIQAPTYSSANVNPAENYSRYVGLFLLATGEKVDDAGSAAAAAQLTEDDFLTRPRLLGFIDTEGNTIDANIAAATQN